MIHTRGCEPQRATANPDEQTPRKYIAVNPGNLCGVDWLGNPLKAKGARRSDPKLIEFEGEWATLTDHAKKRGLNPQTVRGRIRCGWTLDEALNSKAGWGQRVRKR